MPISSKGGIAWPNGLYCFATWPVLQAKTCRLGSLNGPFCNALNMKQLSKAVTAAPLTFYVNGTAGGCRQTMSLLPFADIQQQECKYPL